MVEICHRPDYTNVARSGFAIRIRPSGVVEPDMQAGYRPLSLVGLGLILAIGVYVIGAPIAPSASNTTASISSNESGLPQADDLTFGQDAGKVLIGLTVRPARPGPNTLLVYALPLEGPS